MKFQLALISALLLLGLVSCSLAEDVTPPPDYVAPTVAPTNTPAPAATSTPVPPTPTEIPPSPTTDAANPVTTTETAPAETTPEVSPTAGIQTGIVNGMVVNGSGGAIPNGATITLRGFDMPTDPNGQPTESVNQTLPLAADGLYEFAGVEMPAGRIFLTQVEYNGVSYQSDYLVTEQALMTLPDLTIYDTTDDYTVLSLEQVHIELDYSTADTVAVYVIYIITNPSTQTVTVQTDGTSIPFVSIPDGAANASFQVASGSAPFLGTMDGFALVPSVNGEQYGLVASYELPYAKKISLSQSFLLPVATVTFFVPDGVKISGENFTQQEPQVFGTTTYNIYETTDVAAGGAVTVKITGKPATAAAGTSGGITQNQWLIIGLGALGMALVGIGMFFFIRDRRQSQREDEELEDGEEDEEAEGGEMVETQEPTDALGDDRDTLLDAILALDDQFKAGEISKEVYETRRAELKDRLKNLG